ncbi:MAG: HutD family protein [Rhizorhabdus sp.]
MSVVRVIRHGDCPEIAWKNGGGTTREIAVFPPGAGISDFLWRISIARVESAGPFSAFDGVDRVLAVLEGKLELRGPNVSADLDDASAPFAFDGGTEVTGRPLDGPVLDLNAMARRGAYNIDVRRVWTGDTVSCNGTTFLFALAPQTVGNATLGYRDSAEIRATIVAGGDALIMSARPWGDAD